MNQSSKSRCDAVVITGAGLVTCQGLDRQSVWRGVCESRRAFGPLTELEQRPVPDKGGGQAPALPAGFAPGIPREARYLRHVIDSALREAGIKSGTDYPPHRCGIALGTTLHGMPAAGRFFRSHDFGDLHQFLPPTTLQLAAGDLGFSGFAATICSACSSGLGGVSLALTLLETGELDMVIAGGYDVISEYAYAGFNSLRLVADGEPRPFRPERRGLTLGEGYGVMVLERAADARRRGGAALATVLAAGESADAHHLTQPHPEGDGAARAMRAALERAGLGVEDINLICAHGTATPDNDGAEYLALQKTFGTRLKQTPCVALKSHLGHTLGGAGAVELILTMTAIIEGVVPPTRHAAPSAEFEALSFEPAPRPANIRHTLSLSLGFGGANTCVILGRAQDGVSAPAVLAPSKSQPREVLATGVGVVFPGAIGNAAFAELMFREKPSTWTPATGEVPDDTLISLIESRRVRRMSQYVKLTLAAAAMACRDAGLGANSTLTNDSSAVLGTAHGSTRFSSDYYRQVVEQGVDSANPMLFAEGVPNAGAAHLSLMLAIKGPCQTIVGSRTAGLDALRLAWLRIGEGRWDRAIVCAADEFHTLVDSAYAHCGVHDSSGLGGRPFHEGAGFVSGAGGAAIVLESRASALERGVEPRGQVDVCSSGVFGPTKLRDAVGTGRRVFDSIGSPSHVVSSANGTWLDRLEDAVLRGEGHTVSSLYGHVAEAFSAAPLAAISLLLLTGRVPPLLGSRKSHANWRAATGLERADAFGVLCSDYSGLWAGARVAVHPARVGVF